MKYADWQQWGRDPDSESRYNIQRVKGNLSEMESTKQLVKLISDVYKPEMQVLDVGCNVGHYLKGIRKQFPNLQYTGVDAYPYYIEQAKIAFENDPNCHFEIKDIFKPIFPNNPYDIVYCCNVLLHLPDFRIPVKNLLNSTKNTCFIRTLLGEHTNIVKSPTTDKYDSEGNPLEFWYLNTWNQNYFREFVNSLGWEIEFILDTFDPSSIQTEFEKIKTHESDKGTEIIGNHQVIENVLCNWKWAKITRKHKDN